MVKCAFCGLSISSLGHRCRGEVLGATGSRPAFRGRVRVGNDILYVCDHVHRNRDQSSYTWGPSALDCAAAWLRQQQLGVAA